MGLFYPVNSTFELLGSAHCQEIGLGKLQQIVGDE